jgi:hypothetical protein
MDEFLCNKVCHLRGCEVISPPVRPKSEKTVVMLITVRRQQSITLHSVRSEKTMISILTNSATSNSANIPHVPKVSTLGEVKFNLKAKQKMV